MSEYLVEGAMQFEEDMSSIRIQISTPDGRPLLPQEIMDCVADLLVEQGVVTHFTQKRNLRDLDS